MARIMGALITASVIAGIPLLESLIVVIPVRSRSRRLGRLHFRAEAVQHDAAHAVVVKIASTAWTHCLPRTYLPAGG